MNIQETHRKWANVPGVIYPEVKEEKKVVRRSSKATKEKRKATKNARIAEYRADGYISTAQAEKLLKLSKIQTTRFLKKHGVRTTGGSFYGLFWKKEDVMRLVKRRDVTVVDSLPSHVISIREVVEMTGKTREYINQLARKGKICRLPYRLKCDDGYLSCYNRKEIEEFVRKQ